MANENIINLDLLTRYDGKLKAYADEKYAKKEDAAKVYCYKGSVPTYKDLPQNAEVGDVYNVGETPDGTNYAWTEAGWDSLGAAVDLSAYALKTELIGKKTPEGGEIFNNYENNKATNSKAHAEGHWTTAGGVAAHAEGLDSTASGKASHAEGWGTLAEKDGSHAEGIDSKAKGQGSHAEGQLTEALGNDAHAEGSGTTANGDYAHSEGLDTNASGMSSHAEGRDTIASSSNSHAEGWGTEASGTASHTEGLDTKASGEYSHAEGRRAQAKGEASHAGGFDAIAEGEYSFAHGINAHAVVKNSYALGTDVVASGIHSFVTGNEAQANGNESFATGYATIANGDHSFAEGALTIASGENAHASGHATIAKGDNSYAGGYGTYGNTYECIGHDSTMMGVTDVEGLNVGDSLIFNFNNTIIITKISYISGIDVTISPSFSDLEKAYPEITFEQTFTFTKINATEAVHNNSFAHGVEVKTGRDSQAVFGRYNEVNNNALFIVGNGENTDNRKNAFEIILTDTGSAIKIGNITLTEEKLEKLIKFIDSVEL